MERADAALRQGFGGTSWREKQGFGVRRLAAALLPASFFARPAADGSCSRSKTGTEARRLHIDHLLHLVKISI
jgi:hypothetical protein